MPNAALVPLDPAAAAEAAQRAELGGGAATLAS
jgi:hypothetical protein